MCDLTRPNTRLRGVLEAIQADRPFALVTVIATDGSSPARVGATAIVGADGSIRGTVGGGIIEAKAQRRAVEAIATGRPAVVEFDLHGAGDRDDQPICGGRVRFLVDPTAVSACAACEQALRALTERRRGLWMITLADSDALEVTSTFVPESDLPSWAGEPGVEALRGCLATETPALFRRTKCVAGRTAEIFADPLVPAPVLLIVGGGHVGRAVAAQAGLVGFDIVVLDDRPEFTRRDSLPPETRVLCGDIAEEVARFPLGPGAFVVLVTRGHQHDAEALAACLRRPAAYVGMIGSRRKVNLLRRDFLASGRATAEEFDRVYAPIGLDLGAATVPEIAASIVAQLIAVRRRGTAPRIPCPAEP